MIHVKVSPSVWMFVYKLLYIQAIKGNDSIFKKNLPVKVITTKMYDMNLLYSKVCLQQQMFSKPTLWLSIVLDFMMITLSHK